MSMTPREYELGQLRSEIAAIVQSLPDPIGGRFNNTEELMIALRTWMKYLLFDLEATRRENHYLREMLGHRDGNDDTQQEA